MIRCLDESWKRWLIALGLLLVMAIGCDGFRRRGDLSSVDYSQFAELPGARASHSESLQAELARIVDERATPKMMMEYRVAASGTKSLRRPRLPDEENAAVEFAKLFDRLELKNIQHRLDRTYPAGDFAFTSETLFAVRDALKHYSKQRKQFRAAVARPASDLNWQHVQGAMADTSCVDNTRAAIRLELLAIGELLQDNRPLDTIEPLQIALRAITFLADEPHLIPRQEAARARIETLRVVQAIVQHPAADRALQSKLFDIVSQQLTNWPPDRHAWIGERAEGLHTYELVRVGHLLSVLDETEIKRLHEAKNFRQTMSGIRESIDDDELFYLAAMRKIIDSCEVPFIERRPVFVELHSKMEDVSRGSVYPFIAIRVLLKDFERGHQLQARDRALCEAWAIVLALALDQAVPEFSMNPLTGAPYKMLKQKDRAVVANVLSEKEDRPLVVPIRPEPAPAR